MSGGGGGIATRATPLPGPFEGDPEQGVCLDAECSEFSVTGERDRTPWVLNGTRYVRNPNYVEPWYSDYLEYGFVFGPPLAGLVGATAPAVVAFEGPVAAVFAYGRGRLVQVRFGRDRFIVRIDVNKPHTHVNIQTRTRNIHLPKAK